MSFTLLKFYFGSQQWDFKSFHFDETKIEHFLAYTDALYKSQSIDATTIEVLPLSLLVFFSLSFHAHTFCQPGIMYLSHLLTHTPCVRECHFLPVLFKPYHTHSHTHVHPIAMNPPSLEELRIEGACFRHWRTLVEQVDGQKQLVGCKPKVTGLIFSLESGRKDRLSKEIIFIT